MITPCDVLQQLFAVQHRFVDLDGGRIHYVDEGAGETLLLLHGNPSWSFLYRKIVAALRSDFRCVALDFPGYGMSDAPASYRFTPNEHSDVLEHFVDRLGHVEANLPKLADRPALIVWGMKDFAFRDAERERFDRLFWRHKTVLLDDASHFLQEDAGDRIAESRRVFVKGEPT